MKSNVFPLPGDSSVGGEVRLRGHGKGTDKSIATGETGGSEARHRGREATEGRGADKSWNPTLLVHPVLSGWGSSQLLLEAADILMPPGSWPGDLPDIPGRALKERWSRHTWACWAQTFSGETGSDLRQHVPRAQTCPVAIGLSLSKAACLPQRHARHVQTCHHLP